MSDTAPTTPFDLDAYLRRTGWEGVRRACLDTLRGLQHAHVRAIPFENLDPVRGRAPSLDLADLTAKLVHARRGGYCYEHNTLFARVLETLGFGVTRLLCRVQLGAHRPEDRPRSHLALQVRVPGDPQTYLSDVGFGAVGALLEPVPLRTGEEFPGAGRRHRLVHRPHRGPLPMWVLEAHGAGDGGGWEAQYAFTLEPFEHADVEVVNWHVATSPRSPFSRTLYIQRLTTDAHLLLHGTALTETRTDGTVTRRELTGEAEIRSVIDTELDVEVPDGLTLPR
ncbi:arylamine N-acetyltransferase family protein [Streptomyces poriticola]|uniref:arylamine N-acetyltransferase family protein n=1 Tax=Streptomyces poriticola TaxID=3120506 RepID=UPI002FCE33B6